MVQSINLLSKPDGHSKKIPRVVEIIGPAGAGKTTICQALYKYPDQICLGDFPNVRRIADAPFFIWYGLQLMPTMLRLHQRASRRLSRREFAWMSILYGWPIVLQRALKKTTKVIVLDQGPVYLLAEMREFGPEYLQREEARKLWQDIYCRWAATLDLIVWLDAADINLMERIRTRDQEHIVKNETAATVFEFLARYRNAYDYVLYMLKAITPGLRVLRFDTSVWNPREIVDSLSAELYF